MRLQSRHPKDEPHPVAVPLETAGRQDVERQDPLAEGVEQWLLRVGGGQPGPQIGQPPVEVAPHDVVLRGEVAKERAAPDAGGRRDVLDRCGVEAASRCTPGSVPSAASAGGAATIAFAIAIASSTLF